MHAQERRQTFISIVICAAHRGGPSSYAVLVHYHVNSHSLHLGLESFVGLTMISASIDISIGAAPLPRPSYVEYTHWRSL